MFEYEIISTFFSKKDYTIYNDYFSYNFLQHD